MLQGNFKQFPYMLIINAVKNAFSVSAIFDYLSGAENAQLMRNGGLTHADDFG